MCAGINRHEAEEEEALQERRLGELLYAGKVCE